MSEATAVEHKTLAAALVAAQAEMPAVGRDGTNPHFQSRFATLGHLLAKVRPVLNRHGIAVMQLPVIDPEGRFVLRTVLTHGDSGERVEFDAPLTPTKNDPQGQGSAITYMRRYCLAAALAIADQDDDDGNAASASADAGEQTAAGNGRARAVRRNGQQDGRSAQATPAQRRTLFAEAQRLGLAENQLRALIEWRTGTAHTDRIPKAQASELIETLTGCGDAVEAMAAFNDALDAGDERAQAIAAKHSGGGEG